jgi:putative oxidoreductase
MQDLTALVGRILLVGLFLLGGWGKVNGLDGTANYIASKGLPMPQVLAMASAAVELIGAILIVIGFKTRLAALALAAFTLAASVIFHNYWAVPEAARSMQYLLFTKNIGILGGLLVLAAFGPGRYSVDGRSSY